MTADQIKTRLRTLKLEASQLRAKLRRLEPKARKAKVRRAVDREGAKRAELYRLFREEHAACWICKREAWQKPRWWAGPYLIERMHIVNKPRVEDVRVIIAACTLCHRIEHGERFRNAGDFSREPLTIEQLCEVKREHDPDNYDPEFIQKHSIRRLEFPK
jgi:hypothetical protein